MLPLTKLPLWLDAVNELEIIMKNTFAKKIEKNAKAIVKKTSKTAKRNPLAAVGIGSAITGIAATAIAATTIKSTKHGFAAIAAKRAAKAANNNENITTPEATETTENTEATAEQTEEANRQQEQQYHTVMLGNMAALRQAVINQ